MTDRRGAAMTSTTFDALVAAIIAGDPDDLADQYVLADWLEDHDDSRATGLRRAISLWEKARTIQVDSRSPVWDEATMQADLTAPCQSKQGWRNACLLGCLVAYHAPSGEPGKTLGQTPGYHAVSSIQQQLWLIAAGVLDRRQADAAVRQANAARQQAGAAVQQVWQWARECWEMIVTH